MDLTRPHPQIRAHLAFYGHHWWGHQIRHHAQNKGSGHSYQALYAYRLRFAFTTDASILSYLNGKEFRVGQVGFANEV